MSSDDPFERLKALLLFIFAVIVSSAYVLILVVGLTFIAILLLLHFLLKFLGFK